MALEGDATNEMGAAGSFHAFDLPDLSLPASDGFRSDPAVDEDTTPGPLDPQLLEPTAPGAGSRITRLDYGRHLRVLLVESRDDRAEAFTRAAHESVLDVHVERVVDIDATLARLERATSTLLRKPLPDVIIVSLPTAAAHQLLEVLKLDERFDEMPILVLNDTADPAAERRSFALGATAHLVAPRRDYERVALVHALPDFIPRARAVHAHLESHRR